MALGGCERSEQPGGDFRGDALPVVPDGDEHTRIHRPGVHVELARRLDAAQGVDRVGQEIDHDLLELDGVAFHRREIGVETPAHRDLVDAEAVRHEIERAAHDVVQVDARHLAFGRAHEPQQAAQQLGGPSGLAQDLRHLAARLVREARIGEPVLGVRGDRHEGVVHFMGDPGEQLTGGREAALLFGAVPQHLGHGVEMQREPPDLVRGVHGHADGEVAVGHARQPGLELAQGAPDAPPYHPHDGGHEQDPDHQPHDRIAPDFARRFPQGVLPREQIVPGDDAHPDPLGVDDPIEGVDRRQLARRRRASAVEPGDEAREGGCHPGHRGVGALQGPAQRGRDRRSGRQAHRWSSQLQEATRGS